jgi:transcriptional regulator with PAS, ATPase and Fis domain
MAERVLLCWIGNTDLRAGRGEKYVGDGPIGQVVGARDFDRIVLLSDHPKAEANAYCAWLRGKSEAAVELQSRKLSGPTQFGEIYEAAVDVLSQLRKQEGSEAQLTFHLSPGTPAMAAVWIILAKTRFPAELVESSKEHGVRTAAVPFDISADFIPDLLRKSDEERTRLALGQVHETADFEAIICRSSAMKQLIAQARRSAVRSIPILIEGASGTGKELFARAIHRASPRRDGPFIAVNCGAIPTELVESELFGHVKGAFTGALTDREGHFEKAKGGTLFLDEVGELPKAVQVKLLRVLQEKEVVRIGGSKAIKLDVRILAATNRSLVEEIGRGTFREDLFHRLAVEIIRLPPLRERTGDVSLLIDRLLERINDEARHEPGFMPKKISAAARNILGQHKWPGNVRELHNTLQRAALWEETETISGEVAKRSILAVYPAGRVNDAILNRPLEEGVDLQELIREVASHYLGRALQATHGNKTQAARMLGISNYQTLTNWMDKYGVRR